MTPMLLSILEFAAQWTAIAAGGCFGWWLIRSAQAREDDERALDEADSRQCHSCAILVPLNVTLDTPDSVE